MQQPGRAVDERRAGRWTSVLIMFILVAGVLSFVWSSKDYWLLPLASEQGRASRRARKLRPKPGCFQCSSKARPRSLEPSPQARVRPPRPAQGARSPQGPSSFWGFDASRRFRRD